MPDLLYSIVSYQPRGIAVRLPAQGSPTKGSWWRWADGTWTAPWKAADHVLACKPDDDNPSLLLAAIPAAALLPGVLIGEYAAVNATPVLDNCCTPPHQLRQ